ncbi:MAG: glycosyltransferase family 2 protein [Candidatus Hermodarchaeota archaeon]
MSGKNPKVTVLMPIYNGETYLNEAIESILNQKYQDFEFLIIDDGSKDRTQQIINSFEDPRIRLIFNEKNIGLSRSLNKGIYLSRGQYIARMDCDDISFPERLLKQVDFMDNHPEVGICGTWVELIGTKTGIVWKYPTEHDEIRISMVFSSAIAHPSVIMRTKKLKEYNLRYNPDFQIAQDYEFWQRCSKILRLANIPEVLLKYRITSTSHFRSKKNIHEKTLIEIYKSILDEMNIPVSNDELMIHYDISHNNFSNRFIWIKNAGKWLRKIQLFNKQENKYLEPKFSETLANYWFWICYKGNSNGLKAWKLFWHSQLRKYNTIPLISKIKFLISATIKQGQIFINFIS